MNNVYYKKIVIFCIATVAVTICSMSSPLYPFNVWCDSNCFMTVGRSMLHGLVPYRDLYEQKGPLLYMIHAVAAMVDESSFIGVYLIEVIAAFFFLYYSYKIMEVYVNNVNIMVVPILASIVYSAKCFGLGDSAEEFCLPLISYALYLSVRLLKNNKLPSFGEYIIVGITSAFVLWIKYTMLGFYFGWFVFISLYMIKRMNIKYLIQRMLLIIIGVLIVSLPVIMYFMINHAITDLWAVYFYNNIFYYSTSSSLLLALINLLAGIKSFMVNNLVVFFIIALCFMILVKKRNKSELMMYCIIGTFTFTMVYIGGRRYQYYSLIFSVFTPVGLVLIYEILQNYVGKRYIKQFKNNNLHIWNYGLLCALCVLVSIFMSSSTYMLKYDREDLPQFQFAKIINGVENATLLNYNFLDDGFYNATGIIPNCKYFCRLNIEVDEMMEIQNEYVEYGKVDFVVVRDEELKSERYALVDTACTPLKDHEYFLYQLIY